MPDAPRNPYRPRTRREPRLQPVRIDDRALDLLAAVADHRFLTKELLLQLFPPDPALTPTKAIGAPRRDGLVPELTGAYRGAHLERRLRELFHAGFLDRIPRGLGKPLACAISAAGRTLLRKHGKFTQRIAAIGPAEHLFYVEHALMVARFRIALSLAVASHPSLELVDSQRESRALRHAWHQGGERFSVNPDGFFLLADRAAPEGRNARAAFLECDRGTMNFPSLLKKYETYARFEQTGKLHAIFGISAARIVTVAATRKRAAELLNLAAETESPLLDACRDRYLFTTEEAYLTHPANVLAQIWRSADKPGERNALVPSPLSLRD